VTVIVEPTYLPEPTATTELTPTPASTITPEATATPTTTGPRVVIVLVKGQVIMAGQANNDWSGTTVSVDDSEQSDLTDATGNFSIANVAAGTHRSITADAPGYLPAICSTPTLAGPETTLNSITLLSGDITDDNAVDIADATAIGASFGETGSDLSADINRDFLVDIFDIILVSANFGEETQVWSCQ
jgi:hypothetical protein